MIKHWISVFGQTVTLVSKQILEIINTRLANLRTFDDVSHAFLTPNTLWTNSLIETEDGKFGNQIFFHTKHRIISLTNVIISQQLILLKPMQHMLSYNSNISGILNYTQKMIWKILIDFEISV